MLPQKGIARLIVTPGRGQAMTVTIQLDDQPMPEDEPPLHLRQGHLRMHPLKEDRNVALALRDERDISLTA